MSKQTPFDTGERYEAKPWYPDRSNPDTYGKVDFEDDAGETSLTVYVGKVDGQRVIHIYDHDNTGYAIDIDDRDVKVELPELDPKLGRDQVQATLIQVVTAGTIEDI